jgi:hypothetical protein
MMQPLSEADHICQTLQIHFDRLLCDVLEKYHSFLGFTLLLGSLCQYMSMKQPYTLGAGIASAVSYLFQQREGYIVDDIGLFGAKALIYHTQGPGYVPGTREFFSYYTELLESPERSGTYIFDQQRYTTAVKECLQLYLCSHHNFSMAATEFACRDKAMRRSKPWQWVARLGVHSTIRKGRHRLTVQQHKSLKWTIIPPYSSFPENSLKHEYCRSVSYQWALDLLPFLLEKSAISLELAKILRSHTFAMMAWKFPRRRRLAKEAIAKYLLRVESAVGNP